jgi:S1-C subfamily serine protease
VHLATEALVGRRADHEWAADGAFRAVLDGLLGGVVGTVGNVVGGLGGVVAGAVAGDDDATTVSAAHAPAATTSQAGDAGLDPEQIYRNAAPGVVVITATQTQEVPPTFFTPAQKQQVRSLGSGFVIDKKGDIVTNDHVVAGTTSVRVGFDGGASYPATVVGTDPSTDVAVVRVKAPTSALHPLAFGDSAASQVGEPVYAIGNPFGLDRTMTAGIVSATGRDINAPNGRTIPNAIQTDAPINHGNSGGPMLDARGRVVGVNAQIEGGTVDANVGVGFAIPSDTASSVARQLIDHGRAEHAWLGVEVATIDPSVARVVRGLPSEGVVVARVTKGSPADKAGLTGPSRQVTVDGVSAPLGGDSIVAVDGKPVRTAVQLADAVASRKPGDKLTLTVVHGGARRTVSVTLGDTPVSS